jgi:alkanesulfonate monooxygenase SsuD/methylene tetrahydromethanopterin reductase-like flavin-dependent oxidoreductase (luciferase family)
MTPQVAVRLTPEHDRLGEWLADASAFDAAGADAIWLELGGDSGLDPLAVVAALAVVTSRSRLVLSVDGVGLSSQAEARALDTVRRLSNDRLTLLVGADRCDEVVAAVPGVPVLARTAVPAGEPADRVGLGFVEAEARRETGGTERWLSAPAPEDRESWRQTCTGAAAREAAGVVVDAEPILLDILRNPNPSGDRRDLNVASG